MRGEVCNPLCEWGTAVLTTAIPTRTTEILHGGLVLAGVDARNVGWCYLYLVQPVAHVAPCLHRLFQVALDHWVQLIFEVRVRLRSLQIHLSTLSNSKYWYGSVRMDPNSQALEWFLPES